MDVMTAGEVEYVIDGAAVTSLQDLYRAFGEAVNGPGGYFGGTLDGLFDCLLGGFGTPQDRRFAFVVTNGAALEEALGHPETARQLTLRLQRPNTANRDLVERRRDLALQGEGETALDWVKLCFTDAGVELRLL